MDEERGQGRGGFRNGYGLVYYLVLEEVSYLSQACGGPVVDSRGVQG